MGSLTKVTGFWEGLTGPARRLLVGAVLIFVVGVFVLMRFAGTTSYATLTTASNASDAAAVTKQLDDLGIRYKLADGGTTIQVPSGDLDKARLDLAGSNVLDGGSVVGNEIFDKSNLGATDFTNRVNLVRATEGELSRTIGRLDPVSQATVKIAMPQEQLFTDDQQPTTASVVLAMKPGMTLDSGQVKGITKLVSGAVPGLKVSGITITDSQGNILNADDIEASGSTAASQRMALESRYETALQTRLDAMLAATLGPGKAVTQVNAVLDLDKVKTDSETFDKASSTPLEQDTSEETLKNGSGANGAVAGASANTPTGTNTTFPAATAGTNGAGTNYSKKTNTQRNGVNRVRSEVEKTPGTVTSQSIAVQVSDQVPAATVAALEDTIKAAVGFQQNRDIVSVQAVPFAADGTAVTAAAAAKKAAASGGASGSGGGLDMMGIAKTGAAGVGLLLLILFARKSLRRRQTDLEKALPELLKRGPVPVSELPPGGATAPLRQLEGQRKTPIEAQMEDLALRKPDDVAQLLRGWLLERR
jgi:flagellar M-ring protein FliF